MALPPHLADFEGRLASRVDEALAGFRRAFETRLREATDRLLADAAAVTAPSSAALLAEVESEALEEIPRREGARTALAGLLDAVRAFDRARTQAEVLSALLAAGRAAADRRALLIVRDDRLIRFGSEGFWPTPEPGAELAFDGELRARLSAASGCLELGADAAAEIGAQLGWSAGGSALVVPLVLRDRIAALLWADRRAAAPELAPLQLLTMAAAQRLELQALTAREATPTLYDGAAAPGAPLPLWSSEPEPAAPPPSATPVEEAAEPSLDAAAAFEIVGDEIAPEAVVTELEAGSGIGVEPVVSIEPEMGASWSLSAESFEPASRVEAPAEIEAVADELWASATTAELDASQLEVTAAPESAAVADLFEVEAAPSLATTETSDLRELAPDVESGVESASRFAAESATTFEAELEAGIATERETEPGAELAAFEAAEPEAPAPALQEPDVLTTMRLPVLNFPLAGAEREPRETTAPIDVHELPRLGATTHEIPLPVEPQEVTAAHAVAPPETDLTEDATLLTRRIPLGPYAPTPEPPSALALAPEVAPFGAPPAEPVAPMAPITPVEDPMERTASRQRSTEVAPPPDLQGPGRAFQGHRAQRTQVDSPTHEEAKRLARLLISEIKLYNEEQVLEGRRNRDLYHRLKEDIDRSRQIYEERIDPGVRSGSDYFHQELVRSLAGGDPRALGI